MSEKAQEFLVTMAWFALGDHFAVEHVERRKQGGWTYPDSVDDVGLGFKSPI